MKKIRKENDVNRQNRNNEKKTRKRSVKRTWDVGETNKEE
jgi:hypothetical protein